MNDWLSEVEVAPIWGSTLRARSHPDLYSREYNSQISQFVFFWDIVPKWKLLRFSFSSCINILLNVDVSSSSTTKSSILARGYDGDQAQVDMEANHQEQEEVEAQMEDAHGVNNQPQRLTRSIFKALGANGRLFSLFVISLFEGA